LREVDKQRVLAGVRAGTMRVFTDPQASPTSFPFKVVQLPGTIADAEVYRARARVCDLGYLREAYRAADGSIGFRCPAEPVSAYVGKGGVIADTVGRKCICNALVANIGLGQRRGRTDEPGIVTAGDDLAGLLRFMRPGSPRYAAADVIATILASRA
jgi:nitronate monooxygenase